VPIVPAATSTTSANKPAPSSASIQANK
jgi:hypothetical protein